LGFDSDFKTDPASPFVTVQTQFQDTLKAV
jgi:hypothetical protein